MVNFSLNGIPVQALVAFSIKKEVDQIMNRSVSQHFKNIKQN